MMQGKNTFQNLTIRNNFMFTQVMLMGDNCKTFLEMVLGFPIDHVVVNYEKPFIHHPEFHGIRLDIYAKDENNTHYNVEIQDASPELISFLNFIEHDTGDQSLVTNDSFVQQLQDSMAKIKQEFLTLINKK